MNFAFTKLAEISGGSLLHFVKEKTIKYLCLDSRTISRSSNAMFIALKGNNSDGHEYLNHAFQNGIRYFMISDVKAFKAFNNKAEASFILVNDTLRAFQEIARAHRMQFNLPVVAITGSNGKTIVKEWLFQLLDGQKRVLRSPKSYNSQVGVPLSVLALQHTDEIALFEAGISQCHEMEKLEHIIRPQYGIFTNIGSAHQEGFASVEQKIRQKMELFQNAELLVYCKDHPEIDRCILKLCKEKFFTNNIRFQTWSFGQNADLQITSHTSTGNTTNAGFTYKGRDYHFMLPFRDKASLENVMHCLTLLISLDMNPEMLCKKTLFLNPVEMRLEMKEGINNCTLINDTYNSDINSLAIALDYLVQQNQKGKKTLILSDILQTGKSEAELCNQVAALIRLKKVDRLIGIGQALMNNSLLFPAESLFYKDTSAFIDALDASSFQNEVILIKGARDFAFERITLALQKKMHTTTLEINLHHLVHNLNVYRSMLKPRTKVMAMVKALSYGSGTFEIANILQYHHVDYLAVAYTDEGIELREAGIKLPIMVMNPEREGFDALLKHRLEPEIYSFKVLHEFIDFLHSKRKKESVNVHVKFDTGMHRLGFNEKDVPALCALLQKQPEIKIASVFSHLASSGNPEDDAFTREQISIFQRISKIFEKVFGYTILFHILNSSGIYRFPQAQFDMVRLGIGLYGIDASPGVEQQLENVSTFKTTISQIHELPAGESVGYSRHGKMTKKGRVATIGVGYADGFSRAFGNGRGVVLIRGKKARVIGDVCMDMCMADVSDIEASEGDEVLIFGAGLTVREQAESIGTISYELLAGISSRVKRIYYKE